MRTRMALLVSFVLLTLGGWVGHSVYWGNPPTDPGHNAMHPPVPVNPKDVAKMPPLTRQFHLTAHRGADWLLRSNRPDGGFEYGVLTALKAKLDGDHYLRQAGAAAALARAARYFKDDKQAAVAQQAILTLLLDTTTSQPADKGPAVRHTALPSIVVNRLAAAGLLVLAISELPSPNEELLSQSEELCRFIKQQQQPDGSLAFTDAGTDKAQADPEGINYYPGEALYGLMRSQAHRPAPWKTEVVRKALAYYRPWWQKNKNMAFVPWQTGAFAEAYLMTNDAVFAEFVNEMNDWVCTLQYSTLDPQHPLWLGGFMGFEGGKPVPAPPQVGSAAYAEGLADACRVAKKGGDVARYQRYRDALERGLTFSATLQYTDANTQHFADWYRPRLLGGFHASATDGNLRIDYNQHAVCALVHYLNYVAVD